LITIFTDSLASFYTTVTLRFELKRRQRGVNGGWEGGREELYIKLHNNTIHNIEGSQWFSHIYLHRMDFLINLTVLRPQLAMKAELKAGCKPHLCNVIKCRCII
jgi:hypothetical protein